jgi:hypothetical protein
MTERQERNYRHKERRSFISKCIKEYVGREFAILSIYLHGGYEDYVRNHLDEFTHKNVFGKKILKESFKNIPHYRLEDEVLQVCKDTVDYVNKQLKTYDEKNK